MKSIPASVTETRLTLNQQIHVQFVGRELMPYKNPDEQREYQRNWRAKRRADFFMGKTCVRCGATEELQLDHIDRNTKVHHGIWSWSEERRNSELAKCQILCLPCHKTKTIESVDYSHGEIVGTSKLSRSDVDFIRSSTLSNVECAERFGVHRTAIWKIRKGINWKIS